jgi:hypothetical protein
VLKKVIRKNLQLHVSNPPIRLIDKLLMCLNFFIAKIVKNKTGVALQIPHTTPIPANSKKRKAGSRKDQKNENVMPDCSVTPVIDGNVDSSHDVTRSLDEDMSSQHFENIGNMEVLHITFPCFRHYCQIFSGQEGKMEETENECVAGKKQSPKVLEQIGDANIENNTYMTQSAKPVLGTNNGRGRFLNFCLKIIINSNIKYILGARVKQFIQRRDWNLRNKIKNNK